MSGLDNSELRVVEIMQRDRTGVSVRYSVLDGNGWAGCFTDFATEAEAQAWLLGYEQGLYDNR